MNNDGHQEVIAAGESGNVFVWNADGSYFPGWPQHTQPSAANVSPSIFGGVAVGDLFGDGNKELVVGAYDQHVFAWNKNGVLLSGFPIHVWDSVWDTPALADLEHTGKLDIIIGADSTGPPYDPYPSGGEMWAFRPTGCLPRGVDPNKGNCAVPGWPKTFDQVPWSSPAVADLFNNGNMEVVSGTGFNFPDPRGHYINAWTSTGATFGSWPVHTGARTMSSVAIGDIVGNGQRQIAEQSADGMLYALDGSGNNLPGWPIHAGSYLSNPTIAPISNTQNGIWILIGANLRAYDKSGNVVWSAQGLDWGGFAAPAVGDLGAGSLSVVTVDQTGQFGFDSWTVRAFTIPGTTKMLPNSWPTFHGNAQLSGTMLPSATLNSLAATQGTTQTTVSWSLDPGSPTTSTYTLWVKDSRTGVWQIYGHTGATNMPFNGLPGHSYTFAIAPGAAEPSFSTGTVSTTFSGSASWSTPFKGLYSVDSYASLHGGSSAPMLNTTHWPFQIARGIAMAPGGQGGIFSMALGAFIHLEMLLP